MKIQMIQSRMMDILTFFVFFRSFIKSYNKHLLLIKMIKLLFWLWGEF